MLRFLLLSSCLVGLGSAGFADVQLLNTTITIFGQTFQNVVIQDVGNLTNIAEQLENAQSLGDGFNALQNLTNQFDYTYNSFNTALQFLVNVTVNISSEGWNSPSQLYIPEYNLQWNEQKLEKGGRSLTRIIAALQNLRVTLSGIQGTVVVNPNGTASVPKALLKQYWKDISIIAGQNQELSNTLKSLYKGIDEYYANNLQFLKYYGADVPVQQYGKVMQILSSICGILRQYFYSLIPKSIIVGGNSTDIQIDVPGGLFNAEQTVSDMRDLYAATKAAMDQVLNMLK